MFQQFFAGLLFAVGLLSPRRDAQVQFLLLQIKIAKARLKSDRIVPTPEEKAELLRLGASLHDDISDIIAIVKPETYRKWRVQSKDGKVAKRSGPPGLVAEIKELICTLAKDNVLWGYRRIVGELKKLGHVVAPSSVKRVMAAHDLHPSPSKSGPKPPIPWSTFVHAHMETMVAVDFFTKPIFTLWGRYEAFLLVFIHLKTRKVYCSTPTKNPDSAWVMQQARNASMWLESEGVKPKYLIHDRDRKFPDKFKDFWKAEDVRAIKIPPKAPKANAYIESFGSTLKRECLNHFFCFSLDQLHYISKVWCQHYNTWRPHRGHGMNNNVLDEGFKPRREGPVRCREKLGGLIKEYYREAA